MGLQDWIPTDDESDSNYKPCPNCGASKLEPTNIIASYVECSECGHKTKSSEVAKSFKELRRDVKMRRTKRVKAGHTDEEIEALAERAEGSSVTPESLYKKVDDLDRDSILSMLDEGEQPHYLLHGSNIDVEGGGDNLSFFGNDRSRKSGLFSLDGTPFSVVITDKRLFTVIPQFAGNDYRHIPFDSITSVDFDTGLLFKRLTIQTHGRTYHISVSLSEKSECRAAMEFIRKQRDAANNPEKQVVSDATDDDPLSKLERLQTLREKGALSDDEFESKKRDLLEQV